MRLLATLVLTLFACTAMTASAGATATITATPEIEGVWSFNGGAVDIAAQPGGTFMGTVTKPTKFSKCVHPVAEHMWTDMRLQSDGSYWGFHQWYFGEGSQCAPNDTLGPTAWRVLHNEQGEKYLRVCFSAPGSGLQPTIAANGSDSNVDYGCESSAAIAPLPSSPTVGNSTMLPPSSKCIQDHSLHIMLRRRQYDPFKQLIIRIHGKKVLQLNGIKRLRKPIVLTHLPSGTYTIQILATTVIGQHMSGKRTYSACSGSTSEVKLHEVKKHHRRKHHR